MEDLQEKKYSNIELFKRELNRSSVFRDINALDPSYIPSEIYFRDDIIKTLIQCFRRFTTRGRYVNCLLAGPCGSGKTTITKFFARHFREAVLEENPNFITEYYNCIEFRSKSQILRNLLAKYKHGSGRGFSDEEMWQILIKKQRYYGGLLLLIIDEVQFLKPLDLLSFLNIGENFGYENVRIAVLLISRIRDWMTIENERLLSRLNESITLEPYKEKEVFDILHLRCEKTFREGVVTTDILQEITTIVLETENLRHGFEILRRSGTLIDIKGMKSITSEIIKKAKKDIYSPYRAEVIDKLRGHELFAFYALIKSLKEKEIVHIDEIYPIYQQICEHYHQNAQVKMSFRYHIRTLKSLRLFTITLTKKETSRKGQQLSLSYSNLEKPHFLEDELKRFLDKKYGGA